MELRNGKAFGAWERLSRREADLRTLRNQQASPLLRLPGEIRNAIYEYALGGHHIYLNEHYPKLRSILIRSVDGEQVSKHHLFALGNTCRQTYSESAVMLLSLNEILGYFWSTIEHRRCARFTPSQRDAIRNISVLICCFRHFKSDETKIIDTFGGLQRITLVATGSQYNESLLIDVTNIDRMN
ncbi:hypothetical protein G6011_07421 [Alternaria panax]|uniref:DUF7730 domain-containing protein n=1 Tax=Alternaria panax TaxID=48097 RepID=A0AAD4FHC6_9PLEO|nr:hypothetical protein G6011_07421 [Alternaria panax]